MHRNLWQDVIYSFRLLTRNVGFSLVVVLILALAIGGNLAIFSIAHAVFLSPLPYPHSNRLVQVTRFTKSGHEYDLQSSSKLIFIRDHNDAFEFVAGTDAQATGLNLTGNGEPHFIKALGVSADFFNTLHVQPRLGRGFQPGDDAPPFRKSVVLSDSLWKQAFGGDPAVVGKPVNLSGDLYTVVGVMPPAFRSFPNAEAWFPLELTPDSNANKYILIAYRKVSIPLQQAQSDINRLLPIFRQHFPKAIDEGEQARIRQFRERLVGNFRAPLMLLLSAVGLVLLIACTNIANLLLAKASARRHEIALRNALGATRWKVIRQMLLESAMLSLAGAIVGLVVTYWALPILISISPKDLPFLEQARVNGVVFIYALALTSFSAILFGAVPAWQLSRSNISEALHENPSKGSMGRHRFRLIEVLVTAQVACCIVLLTGAALLIRSFVNLQNVNSGFDARGVLVAEMSLRGPVTQQGQTVDQLYGTGLEEIKSLPGVEDAAVISSLPLGRGLNLPFDILTGPNDPDSQISNWRYITPDYFKVMRIPLVAGRMFSSDADSTNSAGVVIINQAFAHQYFQRSSPLGQQVRLGRFGVANLEDRPRQIIGVVGDVRQANLTSPARPTAYVPASQVNNSLLQISHNLSLVSWVVRTRPGFSALPAAMQQKILDINSNHPFAQFQSLNAIVSGSLSGQKFSMLVVASFAALALVLAMLGLHGVITFSVAQRTSEIGIRLALGAHPSGILRLVLAQAGKLVLTGAALGTLIAIIFRSIISSLLFGVSTTDIRNLALVIAGTAGASMLICYVPARRATKVDPLLTLKHE
jgi:predicted permease